MMSGQMELIIISSTHLNACAVLLNFVWYAESASNVWTRSKGISMVSTDPAMIPASSLAVYGL